MDRKRLEPKELSCHMHFNISQSPPSLNILVTSYFTIFSSVIFYSSICTYVETCSILCLIIANWPESRLLTQSGFSPWGTRLKTALSIGSMMSFFSTVMVMVEVVVCLQ